MNQPRNKGPVNNEIKKDVIEDVALTGDVSIVKKLTSQVANSLGDAAASQFKTELYDALKATREQLDKNMENLYNALSTAIYSKVATALTEPGVRDRFVDLSADQKKAVAQYLAESISKFVTLNAGFRADMGQALRAVDKFDVSKEVNEAVNKFRPR